MAAHAPSAAVVALVVCLTAANALVTVHEAGRLPSGTDLPLGPLAVCPAVGAVVGVAVALGRGGDDARAAVTRRSLIWALGVLLVVVVWEAVVRPTALTAFGDWAYNHQLLPMVRWSANAMLLSWLIVRWCRARGRQAQRATPA